MYSIQNPSDTKLPGEEKPLPHEEAFADWSRRLAVSDRRAYGELFKATHPLLLRFAWRFTKDREVSRDIVQDAFLKLWQVRTTLDPNRSLRALLYTIVRNLALNAVRDHRHTDELTPDTMRDGESSLPDDQLESRLLESRLHQYIRELPERRREAFTLSRFEGLTHAEIAQIMNLTPRTVNTHITLAMRDLRKRMYALQNAGDQHEA